MKAVKVAVLAAPCNVLVAPCSVSAASRGGHTTRHASCTAWRVGLTGHSWELWGGLRDPQEEVVVGFVELGFS